jgi:putative ABC transport system permease protein
MVEEQRIELGTMKALGYSNTSICIKYCLYALIATVVGGFIGMCIGFNLIPSIIISMYQMMYPAITDMVIEFNVQLAIMGLGIMIICTIGATIYSSIKELASMPAMLMRPKPPKSGKRVFLEKIPFIWNKLGFTEKVTVRNMFRYKKRFLMTVIGIMGCTALILTGFAIKDSISNLMNLQYDNVYNYDIMLTTNSSLVESEKDDLVQTLENDKDIVKCTKAYIGSNEARANGNILDVQVIVTDNQKEFAEFIKLNNIENLEQETLNDDEIFITEKASELLNIKAGDTIELVDNDENVFKAKVGAIVENYVYHYVYMTSNLYEKIYGEEYSTNVIYVQTNDLTEDEENALNESLLSNAKISSLTSTTYLKNTLENTVQALNKVVYILIISAGLLAFVVLFNLANVNISERIRELATIKVLGFYDNEVHDYVTKEIVLLTVIGIIIGLFAGYGLSVFILKTCETEPLIFKIVVQPLSYLYSAIITIVFTVIVNCMTYFVLKKVDMIESLKSVE